MPTRRLFVAAIMSASLLGLALAYCACTLMPLVAGHHAVGAALVDPTSPDAICSSTQRSSAISFEP